MSTIAGLLMAMVFMVLALGLSVRLLVGHRIAGELMGKLTHSLVLWIIHRILGPPRVRVEWDRRGKRRSRRD